YSRARKTSPKCATARRPRSPRESTGYGAWLQFFGEDHFRESLASGNHRKYVLGLIGDHVEEYQPVLELERLAQRAFDVARAFDLHADVTVRLRQFGEIGQRVHVRLSIAVAIEEFLPLPDHSHVLVVEVHDLDRQ